MTVVPKDRGQVKQLRAGEGVMSRTLLYDLRALVGRWTRAHLPAWEVCDVYSGRMGWGEGKGLGRRNSMCKGSEAQLLGDQPGSGVR